jgi:outer membrane receptor protein involved in Fe transport
MLMSVLAVSGEALQSMGIDNLEDLSNSTPSFTVGDTMIVNQITMRGIGSGEDRGLNNRYQRLRMASILRVQRITLYLYKKWF